MRNRIVSLYLNKTAPIASLCVSAVLAFFIASCRQTAAARPVENPRAVTVAQSSPPGVAPPTSTGQPSQAATALPQAATWTASPPPTWTSTPDPYEDLTIDYLVSRSYGGGELSVKETLQVNRYFTRTLITYPSDGLTIYGFMDVPKGWAPPYPVIIALHGYLDPQDYQTLDYTTFYADSLARAGFLVLHPNLRGYPPSDSGPNLLRVGMAVDVLNLIALVKSGGGQPGPLALADGRAIGLWGHSMGGGIATRVITVSPDVRAALLYAPMSGDERQNFEAIQRWSGGTRGVEELEVPEDQLLRISPIYFLERIQAAVSIHHGRSDLLVPLQWSQDLCQSLKDLGKTVECFFYKDQPHTFTGEGNLEFVQRSIEFFKNYLRSP